MPTRKTLPMPPATKGAEAETLSSQSMTDTPASSLPAPARAARTRLVISDDRRAEVADLAGKGVPRGVIARMLGVSPRTLRRHFGRELEQGAARAHARIVETLYAKALEGHAPSLIFWCRVRLGWGAKAGDADDGPLEGEGDGYGAGPRGGAPSPPLDDPVALASLNDAQLEALLRRLEAAGPYPGADGGAGGD